LEHELARHVIVYRITNQRVGRGIDAKAIRIFSGAVGDGTKLSNYRAATGSAFASVVVVASRLRRLATTTTTPAHPAAIQLILFLLQLLFLIIHSLSPTLSHSILIHHFTIVKWPPQPKLCKDFYYFRWLANLLVWLFLILATSNWIQSMNTIIIRVIDE
jgi:hypothetical protein